MKVVGELFGSGEMQLPFVLQSAETMKASVAHLEPHMEKVEGDSGKGRIVLATVKGDVHDIGKNLVDIILTNNGYEVHNLGIKIGIAEMIEKAHEVQADAIGMSGLLVKSTLIMRDNLEELNTRELADIPVLLGGAALTRTYVERDLREVYDGRLFYGKDAFEGLHVMDRLGEIKRGGEDDDPDWGRVPSDSRVPSRASLGLAEKRDEPPADAARPLARRRDRQPGLRAAVPRLAGRQGHAHRRHRRLHQRDRAVPQPVAVPARERRRERRRVQGPHPADPARAAGQGQGRRPARPAGGLRLLRGQRRRQRPRDLDRRDPHAPSGRASATPARPRRPTSASPTSSARSTGAEVDYAAFHIVTMGPRSPSAPPSCSPTTGTRSTCCCTASASRWPRRSPSSGTAASARSGASPTRTARRSPACSASSTAAAATRGATRRAPTSRTT